jgi:SNF2 family DNA or RNA helicase
VTSGIDWFELHGGVQFGDTEAPLPELLAALRRGDDTVRLGDGTYGMLPQDWLKKYGMLAGLGTAEGDHLRFGRSQVGLLDALLAAQPEATCDAVFAQVRDELQRFAGVEASDPPAGFVGQLRGYQRDGLGWLYFLQKFGFGGCLADDMGLGKTIQVLALLESRRALRMEGKKDRPAPALVVVPRSLVFNWKQEAARFTPELRVLDHTGITRLPPGKHFDDYDVILTTYGTLRRDVLAFKDVTFDYCILDEAQAVKNANTASAKAVRLVRADHRLALSGTPVENHLGELWSLFDFLNPGMLGSASVFRMGAGGRQLADETAVLLARALRPFILRRTKEQVARDLPQKLEQTLYCELEPAQRKRYDELREHFRRELLGRVDREGLNRSKMQILEALLRLRQAACHPGLIDKAKTPEPSAKLDALLPQLAEVLDEGHKALVFSQFTSFLAIVRDRLDRDGVVYEYLDGRTRDRAAKVERFQSDPDCKLFLVSLKAGGLGLNLTAAEYVFLLDPWWNPAVEAQAIDRTHRIGQTRPVFAYRLIAKDTVEEKVLELQKSKRALADAIINADNSLIRNLGREDLELLLS